MCNCGITSSELNHSTSTVAFNILDIIFLYHDITVPGIRFIREKTYLWILCRLQFGKPSECDRHPRSPANKFIGQHHNIFLLHPPPMDKFVSKNLGNSLKCEENRKKLNCFFLKTVTIMSKIAEFSLKFPCLEVCLLQFLQYVIWFDICLCYIMLWIVYLNVMYLCNDIYRFMWRRK